MTIMMIMTTKTMIRRGVVVPAITAVRDAGAAIIAKNLIMKVVHN